MYEDSDFTDKGEAFNEKFKNLRSNKEAYDEFVKKANYSKWKVFKEDFLKITHRCPICEAHITNYDDIDHYRPKYHYWWLAYDYKNYVIMCDHCNSSLKKKLFPLLNDNEKVEFINRELIEDEFPLLFNPMTDNPIELFQLSFELSFSGKEYVKIEPLDSLDKNSYNYKKAKKTIEIFKLDDTSSSKFPIMIDNSASLINLASAYDKFRKKQNLKNRKKLDIQIRNASEKMKIGLAIFILKGQFIWRLP